ncbi:MAG: hypothetical protein GEU76_05430 [Alphaproteobacteria bacterium]|nr:hypothetical protein [Alphaproteobacteria bacterium]
MFGMSLSKLLVLALIIAAVWYGYKWLTRAGSATRGGGRKRSDAPRADDLIACPACGTYVAARLKECPSDRTDCPAISG